MPRTKGAKNKPKRALLGLLQERYGKDFHPIMEIAKIAHNEEADLSLKLNANKELAKYISPQLKQVEVKADIDIEGEIDHKHVVDWIGASTDS